MRKLVVPFALMLVLLAGCSSSKPKASSGPSSSTGPSVAASDAQKICASSTQFASLIANPGSTPTEIKATATKLRNLATTISTDAPASLADSAKAISSTMNNTADQLDKATTAGEATTDLAKMTLTSNSQLAPYAAWVKANCK